MSDWPWVVAAYALTWVALAIYALRIRGQLARANSELHDESRYSRGPTEMES